MEHFVKLKQFDDEISSVHRILQEIFKQKLEKWTMEISITSIYVLRKYLV